MAENKKLDETAADGDPDRFIYSGGELMLVNEDGTETRIGEIPKAAKLAEINRRFAKLAGHGKK